MFQGGPPLPRSPQDLVTHREGILKLFQSGVHTSERNMEIGNTGRGEICVGSSLDRYKQKKR